MHSRIHTCSFSLRLGGGLGRSGLGRRLSAEYARNLANDFCGEAFADRAGGIVDAALRQRKRAAAIAGFGVEAVQRDFLLLRRELRKVHAGKLAGPVRVLQENFAGVLERFHFYAGGQSEERANFNFVQRGIAQPDVLLHDAALRIEDEGSG